MKRSILEMKDTLRITSIQEVTRGMIRGGSKPLRDIPRPWDAFVYVQQGCAEYHFPNETICVSPGEVIYLPKGSTYYMVVPEDYWGIWVDFYFEDSGYFYPLKYISNAETEGIFQRLLKCWMRNEDGKTLSSMAIVYDFCAKVIHSAQTGYASGKTRDFIHRATTWIEENLEKKDLSVRQLADMLSVSATHVRRLFQTVYGVAPHQYIQQMRILRAKCLLLETRLSLSEIADKCGFCNEFYFNRVFKSVIGIPPGIYRNERML